MHEFEVRGGPPPNFAGKNAQSMVELPVPYPNGFKHC
jgi:hypothetical protein